MKQIRIFILLAALSWGGMLTAGVSTYTFTTQDWNSKVAGVVCDNKTDGWVSDKAGNAYSGSYQIGVQVTAKTTGAGATSVQTFEKVRRVTFNYATTTKGQGSIAVQVGENVAVDSVVTIANPSNRDMTIVLPEEQTGRVKFVVNCTKNSIYLNSITIYSSTGGANPFTIDTYQLVTDAAQLADSDQIMIGVNVAGMDYIMGFYDENTSKNNIHAIAGKYTADRTQVTPDDRAVYTLHKTKLDEQTVFYIQDEIRYVEAYLVASGGQTKNVLAAWNKLYDSGTYGNYGYWDIRVAADGTATIGNMGKSKGKYLQYNATGKLFGCYASAGSQTPICIYRRVEALGDTTPIVAPLTNFGTVCKTGERATGSKTITVNANGLTEDIAVRLKRGAPFALSATQLDRDGDNLTITYAATEAGIYRDILVLTSGDVTAEAMVMLCVVQPMKVAEAVRVEDYTTIYLDTVVVTKKYDRYIFVRDHTGAMLIYDTGDADGKRYGSGLENGHVLTGVVGRFQNYFGVPELIPTAKWQQQNKKAECLPEPFPSAATPVTAPAAVDSSLVCKYITLDAVVIDDQDMAASSSVAAVKVVDAFNVGLTRQIPTRLDAIVMLSHNEIQLWCVRQEEVGTATESLYTPEHTTMPYKYLRDGQLVIICGDKVYSTDGKEIK